MAWDVVIMMAFLVTIGAGRLITAAIWKLDGQKISKSELAFWVCSKCSLIYDLVKIQE